MTGRLLSARERLTLAAGLAVLLTCTSLGPVFQGSGWALRVAGAVVVVSLVGLLARRSRLPPVLQPLLGLVALVAYAVLVFAGSTLVVVVPTGDTVSLLRDLVDTAREDISQLAAPVPTSDGLVLLAVLAVGGIAVVVDALAVLADRAALAGLPLLLLFAAPAAIADEGVGWWPFALAAAGWLLLLLVEGSERVSRWGVALGSPGRSVGVAGLGSTGGRIGVAALALAAVLPLVLPGAGGGLVGTGGNGDGGPRTVTTYNPITRLRGRLSLPEPRDILSYTTDDQQPDYLRMTTLETYDGAGWKQGVLNGKLSEDGVDQPLPTPVGVTPDAPSRPVDARIDVLSLDAFWLPLPATPTEVDVNGPWLWDADSQSVFATRTDTTRVDPYEVHSSRATPDRGQLAADPGGALPPEIRPYAEVPEATDRVKAITASVVQGRTSAYDKALALQSWFRGAGGFTYDEQTDDGSSPDALEAFLTGKRGFCEQFSSAMAAMLRLSGVPARVAVGFTPGTLQPDGSRIVTTDDAHAWPEAWFAGAGWLRFEPTPSRGYSPDYTAAETGPGAAPTASAAPGPSTTATSPSDQRPGETPAERDARLEADREAAAAGSSAGDDGGGGFPLAGALVPVAILVLLLLPALLGRLRRRARWQVGGAGAAWEQVRDDARDVGLPLDPTRSPRQVLARLQVNARLTGGAAAALQRISLAVERDRYARATGPGAGADLAADTAAVRQALLDRLPRRQRVRLWLFPPATLRWVTGAVGGALTRGLELLERLSTVVGTRLRRA